MLKTRVFAVVVISAVLVWLYVGNPDNPSESFLKCPLYALTGFQCPLCGSQRAIHHLLHLHPVSAFSYNPWLVAVGIYALMYAAGYWRSHRAVLTMLAMTLGWGVVRNIIPEII